MGLCATRIVPDRAHGRGYTGLLLGHFSNPHHLVMHWSDCHDRLITQVPTTVLVMHLFLSLVPPMYSDASHMHAPLARPRTNPQALRHGCPPSAQRRSMVLQPVLVMHIVLSVAPCARLMNVCPPRTSTNQQQVRLARAVFGPQLQPVASWRVGIRSHNTLHPTVSISLVKTIVFSRAFAPHGPVPGPGWRLQRKPL
jgi:hypothetical protein